MQNRLSSLSAIDMLLLLVVLIWGVNFSVVKIAFAEMNPLTFNGLRFILASVILIAVSALRRRNRPDRRMLLRLLVIGLLGNGVYQILFILGLFRTLVGVTSLILASTPVFVMILDSIFHVERIGYRGWVGVASSFLGIALMIHVESFGLGLDNSALTGELLVLGGTICWAAYITLSRPVLSEVSPLQFVTYTVVLGSPVLIVAAAPSLLAQGLGDVTVIGWAAVVFSATFAIVVAYLIWYSSVQRIGTARTAIYQNLVPVLAVVIAWHVLGEQLLPRQLLGGVLVFLGIYLTRFSK